MISKTNHNASTSTLQGLDVCLFPALKTEEDVSICARLIGWPFEPLSQTTIVSIPIGDGVTKTNWPEYCRTIAGKDDRNAARQAHTVLCWKASAFWAAPAWLRRKTVICDPFVSIAATDTLNAWVSNVLRNGFDKSSNNRPASKPTPNTFLKLHVQCRAEKREVLLIGTAPNQSELVDTPKREHKQSVCIYLSGAITNEALVNRFPPNIIVAADGPSQFSDLEPSRAFKAQVVKIMRQSDALLIVPNSVDGIIDTHWPKDLRARILSIPLGSHPIWANGPPQLHTLWRVEPTGNILTTLALPIACSLSDTVVLAGVSLGDAHQDQNSLHWNHANSHKYHNAIADILANEPGAVLPKAGYRDLHYKKLNMMLGVMDKSGMNIRLASGIPVEPHVAEPSGPSNGVTRHVFSRMHGFLAQKFEIAQHFPGILTVFLTSLVVLFGMISHFLFGSEITLIVLLALCFIALLACVYFLRLRMNRMISEMEGRLSRQQAAQFQNLSERLKQIEMAADIANKKK